jgi:hypothetical protein
MVMVSEHTQRRAGRLIAYTAFADKPETELVHYCEDALYLFLDLTHRSDDPGEAIDPLICDIAKTLMARGGQEGVKKAKDGEMEREWSDQNGGLDIVLMQRIKAYRLVVGINAAPIV